MEKRVPQNLLSFSELCDRNVGQQERTLWEIIYLEDFWNIKCLPVLILIQ